MRQIFAQRASSLYFAVTVKIKGNNQIFNKITPEMSICQAENGFFTGRIGKNMNMR